jgi:hypothetical protein
VHPILQKYQGGERKKLGEIELLLHPNDYLDYRVPMLQPIDDFLETVL